VKRPHANKIFLGIFFLILGFAWNPHYAHNRLGNILSIEYEGKDLILEGRVNALPQSNLSGLGLNDRTALLITQS
jgi:competence protein ComEC